MSWQPIATAPRDGTAVLGIWMPSRGTIARVGGNNYGITAFSEEILSWYLFDDGDDPCDSEVMRPDYWMPLPEPPEQDKVTP